MPSHAVRFNKHNYEVRDRLLSQSRDVAGKEFEGARVHERSTHPPYSGPYAVDLTPNVAKKFALSKYLERKASPRSLDARRARGVATRDPDDQSSRAKKCDRNELGWAAVRRERQRTKQTRNKTKVTQLVIPQTVVVSAEIDGIEMGVLSDGTKALPVAQILPKLPTTSRTITKEKR